MHHFRDVCTEWVCMVDVINFLIKKIHQNPIRVLLVQGRGICEDNDGNAGFAIGADCKGRMRNPPL